MNYKNLTNCKYFVIFDTDIFSRIYIQMSSWCSNNINDDSWYYEFETTPTKAFWIFRFKHEHDLIWFTMVWLHD